MLKQITRQKSNSKYQNNIKINLKWHAIMKQVQYLAEFHTDNTRVLIVFLLLLFLHVDTVKLYLQDMAQRKKTKKNFI